MAASRKVYGTPTNNYQKFVNGLVADERRCSSLLPLQQAKKLADAAWKLVDHGKDEVVASSANDGEYVTKSFVVQVPNFPSTTSVLASPRPDCMQSTVEKSSVEKGSSDCTPHGKSSVSSRSESVVTEFLKSHISLSNGTIASLLSHDVRANVIYIHGSPDECCCSLSLH